MPAQYEAIRDKFIKQGMSEAEAKTRAAKIYNAMPEHKKSPVTPASREKEKKRMQSPYGRHANQMK